MLFVIVFFLGLAGANAQESFPVVSIETPVVVINQQVSADLPLPKGSENCVVSAGSLPDGVVARDCRLIGAAVKSGIFSFSVRFGEARKRNLRTASFSLRVREATAKLSPQSIYFVPPEQSWTIRSGVLRRGQIVRIDSVEGPISIIDSWGYYNDPQHPVDAQQVCFDDLSGSHLLLNGELARDATCMVAGLTAYIRVPANLAGPTATIQLVGIGPDGKPYLTNTLTLPVE